MKKLVCLVSAILAMTICASAKVEVSPDTITFTGEVLVPVITDTVGVGGSIPYTNNYGTTLQYRAPQAGSVLGTASTGTLVWTTYSQLPKFYSGVTGSYNDIKYDHMTAENKYEQLSSSTTKYRLPQNYTGISGASARYSIDVGAVMFNTKLQSAPVIMKTGSSNGANADRYPTAVTLYSLRLQGPQKNLILKNCQSSDVQTVPAFSMALQIGFGKPSTTVGDTSSTRQIYYGALLGTLQIHSASAFDGYVYYGGVTPVSGLFTDSVTFPVKIGSGFQGNPTLSQSAKWNKVQVSYSSTLPEGTIPHKGMTWTTTETSYSLLPNWVPFTSTSVKSPTLEFPISSGAEVIIDGGTYKGSPAISGTLIIVGKLKGSKFELFNLLTRKFIKVFIWQDYPYKSLHQ